MFTKFWKNKIVMIERFLGKMAEAVPEFQTGYLLDKSMAESRPIRHGQIHRLPFGTLEIGQESLVWFRRGQAPKCDYIKCDGEKITYHSRQADAEVNRDGSALKVKKARK